LRDPKRIKPILKELERIWKQCPDMRFNQLMFNLMYTMENVRSDHFHVEDDVFLKFLKDFEGF
jgi:hypothetical protein